MRKKFKKHLRGEPVELLGGQVVRNEGGRGIQSKSRMGRVVPLTNVGNMKGAPLGKKTIRSDTDMLDSRCV